MAFAHIANGQLTSPHTEVINRYHVSPAAAEIYKHGNVPVNLSSGQIRYVIPIYTIRLHDFEWPISLNYAYNGLLLESKPSEVGLGWSLSGGGAVVREVRGLPDEHPHGYWGLGSRRDYIHNFSAPGDLPYHILNDFMQGIYDAEPDKFHVNVGNLSFSFYIANPGSPGNCNFTAINVTPNAENAEVCFSWERIEVRDGNGVTYVFSLREFNELASSYGVFLDLMSEYTSSWFLTEIRLPNTKTINFGYGSIQIESISHSETLFLPLKRDIFINCGLLGMYANTLFRGFIGFGPIHKRANIVSYINAKYLESISWDEGAIEIKRDEVPATNIETPRINRIELKDASNAVISTFDLNYNLNQARPTLSEVTKNTEERYLFEYFPVTIPYITQPYDGMSGQNPYGQDYWGFANGKINTSGIIYLGGNRNPSYEASKQGALTKITYPTGGYTTFTYESNEIKATYEEFLQVEPESHNFDFRFSVTNPPLHQWVTEARTITFTKPTFAKIQHSAFVKGGATQVNVNFGRVGSSNDTSYLYSQYAAEKRAEKPWITPRFYPALGIALTGDIWNYGTNHNCGEYYDACDTGTSSGWIIIDSGTYHLNVSIYNALSAHFDFIIEYYDPGDFEYYSLRRGGIRIKSTQDCAGNETDDCTTKYYQYVDEYGFSSGKGLSNIDYSYSFTVIDAYDCRDYRQGPDLPPLYFEYRYPAMHYSYRSLNPIAFHAGSPAYYNRVEILEGAHKMVIYFEDMDYLTFSNNTYPYLSLPNDPKEGIVKKKEYYKTDETLSIIKETHVVNEIFQPPVNQVNINYGLVFGVTQEWRYTPNNMSFTAFINDVLRNSFIYKKYYTDVPLKTLPLIERDIYYPLNVTQESAYTYDSRLQRKTAQFNTSDGDYKSTTFYYPYELQGNNYNELVISNRINTPVKTEEYVNTNLLKTTQTYYQVWHNSPRIVAPQRQDVITNTNSYTEFTVSSVNSSGNVQEIFGRDGVRISFLWDHHQVFPIAKVVNASFGTFAYTGFEDNVHNFGGWTYQANQHTDFKTGLKAHHIYGAPVSVNNLNVNTTYKLSYWAKGGEPVISAGVQGNSDAPSQEQDGWRYFEKTITGVTGFSISSNVQGVLIDELRLYPLGANMITYAYKPLVGIVSIADENNRITYYEYDTAGRLKYVRDHNRNIIRKHDYHFKSISHQE